MLTDAQQLNQRIIAGRVARAHAMMNVWCCHGMAWMEMTHNNHTRAYGFNHTALRLPPSKNFLHLFISNQPAIHHPANNVLQSQTYTQGPNGVHNFTVKTTQGMPKQVANRACKMQATRDG